MYDPRVIAEVTSKILEQLGGIDVDVGIKMAACRAAGDVINQAIIAQSMAHVVNNALNGDKK